jgi:hypothetical protein
LTKGAPRARAHFLCPVNLFTNLYDESRKITEKS